LKKKHHIHIDFCISKTHAPVTNKYVAMHPYSMKNPVFYAGTHMRDLYLHIQTKYSRIREIMSE